MCSPCLRGPRGPHGRGKTVTVAKGWGLVTNKEEKRLWKS
nr:MAG TPA: Type III restriction enzyme, res subunit [Caudoviricetes sp.]